MHIRELDHQESVEVFPHNEGERELIAYPFDFDRAHFIALEDGRRIGRISANTSKRDPGRGYFGFFHVEETGLSESEDACARALLSYAESWLRGKGASHIVGPVNYSTLFDYRIRLDPEEGDSGKEPFFWEPSGSPRSRVWFEREGYQVFEEYHSCAYRNVERVLPVSEKRYEEAIRSGFSTRPIRFTGGNSPDLEILFRINSRAFQDSFLAEPFDLDAYRTLNVPKYTKLLSDFSFFILNPEGREVGYFFLFPDRESLVWKTLALFPEYQKAGLAGFGIHHALKLALDRGISSVVSALIRRGAPSEALLSRAAPLKAWERRYGVFRKTLG